MALRPNTNVDPESFAEGSTRQTGETGYGSVLVRTTGMLPNARDLQIVNSTLTTVGGDVHNHYHSESKRDIWAILKLVPNFRDIYHDMLEKATPGTGMWLVKGPKFRVWLEPNGDIKIFWGSGIPGAGKTVLASIVIEYLEGLREDSGGTICICYVYFRYSDRLEMTVRDVLEILVKQTLERHPECRDLIERTYNRHLKEGSAPTAVQLLGVLRDLASRMACTFYILDALDEAPARIQLAVVKTLAQLNVKLFITSRPLETVQAKFPHAHTIAIAAQDADLDLHIAKAIGESPELQDLLDQEGPLLKQEIVDTIKENCGGMFLHASLQLEALCDCISTQQTGHGQVGFSTWPNLEPRKGFKVRGPVRILGQSVEHVALAKAVLIWVLHASRSMTVEELRRAVATSPNTHKFQPDRVVPSTTLISLCRGLVTVEEESGLVRLVHYTAKDTLEGLLRKSFPHPQSLLAAVCITHLTECRFQNATISSEVEFKFTLYQDPLLTYASEAWYLHACASLDEEEAKHKTTQFIKECSAFPAFTSFDRTWRFDILTSPLHIMALYKLPMTLMEGMAMGDPNLATTEYQQIPLIVAAGSGYEGLVVYLLTLPEIQVNLVDNYGWSALVRAALGGHEGVVKLLLTHPGIQVNLVGIDGWSALIRAARAGHEGVVKLLLTDPGIQVNLVDNEGWSALMWAAWLGHEGVIKLLLAHPVIQVSLKTRDGLTVLLLAAQSGHDTVVELLATGAFDANVLDNDGNTSIKMAADHGFEAVARLFLDTLNIDITIRSTGDGHTAMSAAQANGHNVIAKLLRDFLSQTPAVVIPEDIDQLFLQERTNNSNRDEGDSDSGSGDEFYDAEAGTEGDIDFS
ncbi:hypothetical protein BKA70DRAFT_1569155 [Coprinopsis sp. MPI-PUGE-AT-0042]|nr:hypothetical protein BKA70DRAFT_1569155 [Coprinopsis sp. MPI-PUGE-AT-0042]